ncbi:aldo/keto reductase [Atopobium fossor]|uniref:aldo/keto reductase n=1 Tax=Atopobium fossor TaxID=39487 RepID=UPI000412C934|nr:aldo/keto reductase [Atopobium fossor]
MNKPTDCFVLSNGVEIPCVGFGTWKAENGAQAKQAVLDALNAGYVHIDTAEDYGNEQSVGDAIKESGIARDKLFVTSKLQNRFHNYHLALGAFEETMYKLQLDYLDLFLIHWPNPIFFRDHWQQANAGAWKAMEELYKAGKIRAIGISNFLPRHIEELMKTAEIAPMVNQIRLCPGETQDELVDYCRERDIVLEAYSPFGHGDVFGDNTLQSIADTYGKSVAQVCVRWSLQRGYLPLPKSVTVNRINENIDVFDFELTAKDMDTISHLPGYGGFHTNPDLTNF